MRPASCKALALPPCHPAILPSSVCVVQVTVQNISFWVTKPRGTGDMATRNVDGHHALMMSHGSCEALLHAHGSWLARARARGAPLAGKGAASDCVGSLPARSPQLSTSCLHVQPSRLVHASPTCPHQPFPVLHASTPACRQPADRLPHAQHPLFPRRQR